MKKTKSGKSAFAVKARNSPETVDEYLAGVPEPARTTLNKIRAVIRSAAPLEATEAISYGMPAFKYNGILVWFAAFSNHCSLFPTASVIDALRVDLRGFRVSKGTVQFPTDKPLPASLVKKMVKLRVAQSEGRKRR
ncbi:MAG TPA: DUF1801 domain-containing protein [Terriglobia bacterium]|nr:DUF1801 domain-containing protein [Terriglobia bacterium]